MRGVFSVAPIAPFALVLLAACSDGGEAVDPEPNATQMPEELRGDTPVAGTADADSELEVLGTPMADRVATIGVLNKRNNVAQDFEMKPGEARRSGNIVVRMSACERTAPWEMPQETGAFVQVIVRDTGADGDWNRVFSGWLFKNAPSLNVVEHPIYDVWVKDCAMSFPGDDEPVSDDDSDSSDA